MIRIATPADAPAIAAYLARVLGGTGGAARYRRYLEYSWLDPKPDLGVVIDDGGIHGFIGAIYARRTIGGREHHTCNLTSISVDESHRKQSLQLFSAMLKRKDLTFTSFSASDQVQQILDFFKFVHCANERVVTTPVSGFGKLLRGRGRPKVVRDPDRVAAALTPGERQVFEDHRRYRCGQFLVVRGDRRCFTVTVRRGRGSQVFADVLHASDPELLVECLPLVHATALVLHRTVLVGIDRRWVPEPPRIAFTYGKLRPIYMRSPTLTLDQIDPLYSEIVPMYGQELGDG